MSMTLALAAAMAVSSTSLAFAMPGDVGKCLDSSVSSEPTVISDAWWNDSVAFWNFSGPSEHGLPRPCSHKPEHKHPASAASLRASAKAGCVFSLFFFFCIQ